MSTIFSLTNLKEKKEDVLASIVVFLVALPLCMGIAIASGVPPASGLITGIIGGLVVGFISGSPLQVSGPAAGLAVICWELVQKFGIESLGIIVLVAGLMQLIAGASKLGQWFRAVPPSLIQGMLAGIGVLILASQFHVMLDHAPLNSGVKNLATIPEAIIGLFSGSGVHQLAAFTGIITILSIIAWDKLPTKSLKTIPGPLIGVIAGMVFAGFFAPDIQFVTVPANLMDSIHTVSFGSIINTINWDIIGAGLAMAFIASAESLLCATAVDQMHTGVRTKYNQELTAQGIGNILCGFLGALPMTGVIIRSKANVQSGAKTRLSTILHGGWILIFVMLLPFVMELIPIAALAGILVYTGYKLVNVTAFRALVKHGKSEAVIYLATLSFIVASNLLTGVIVGFILSLLKTLHFRSQLEIHVRENEITEVELIGAATFLALPKLANALETIPLSKRIKINTEHLDYIDHACLNLIETVSRNRETTVDKARLLQLTQAPERVREKLNQVRDSV